MNSYAILRVDKLKERSKIAARGGHNTRQRHQEHASNPSPLMGSGVRLIAGTDDPLKALDQRITDCGAKPRKGAVLALEFVASASKDWFLAATLEEREAWLASSLEFIREKVGGDVNILAAHLHDDEEVPHLHVIAAPLVQKERKRAGRRVAGQPDRLSTLAWAFSAADIVGGAACLSEMQTAYAAKLSGLGLRRGKPRYVTGGKHKSPSVYRAEVAAATEIQRQAIERAAPAIVEEKATAAVRAMTEGFNAVDEGNIIYQPQKQGSPEKLLPGSLMTEKYWKSFFQRIKPVYIPILYYARAVHQITRRLSVTDEKAREVDRLLSEAEGLAHATGNESAMMKADDLQRKLNQIR